MLSQKIKSFLKDYFTYTSRERKGAMMLIIIIALEIAFLWIYKHMIPPSDAILKEYKIIAAGYIEEQDSLKKSAEKNPSYELFYFDPNHLPDSGWQKLGFSKNQIKVIRNYISKGGQFRKKEDLARMYSISAEQYNLISSYIQIEVPEKKEFKGFEKFKTASREKKIKSIKIIDLNTADTSALNTLPLIGAGRAKTIIRYRESLGGFVSVNQMREVFGIDSSVYNVIEPYLTVSKENIRLLDLNSDSLKHPYLSKNNIRVIQAWRKEHGDFKNTSDLKQVSTITREIYQKLLPYLPE
jgi:DNA uptake protein ComE-like DNA-binding protein